MELDKQKSYTLKSYLEERKSRTEARAKEALSEIVNGKEKETEYMYESGYIAALDMVIRMIEGIYGI